MKSLSEYVQEAQLRKEAIGHFNVSDIVTLRAIGLVARDMQTPLFVGTSEGERNFFGVHEIVALVSTLRHHYGIPIFLNADHTKSFEAVQEAVKAGYDAVLFDAGAQSLEENIDQTRRVVEWVKSYAKEHQREILVEGELGYIGTSSVLLDEIPLGAAVLEEQLTRPDELSRFVLETGVDLVAPAVGNIHGMIQNGKHPQIHIQRIKELATAVSVPIVLHGGSGISDEQLIHAIQAGVRVVHVNTELRIAWRRGFDLAFVSHPHEIVPYKILSDVLDEVRRVVEQKTRLCIKK